MNEDPKRWSQPFAALLGASVSYTHLDVYKRQIIRSAITYVIEGAITDEQFAAIKKHCIKIGRAHV